MKDGLAEHSGTSRQTARRAVCRAQQQQLPILLERRQGRGRPTIYRDPRDPRHQRLAQEARDRVREPGRERPKLADLLREATSRRGPP